jgi:exosortase E/protease (VPEID-CTERM system)
MGNRLPSGTPRHTIISVPWVRGIGLVVLLLAEVLGFSLKFDAAWLLPYRDHWWARLALEAHFLPQLGSAVAISVLIFGGQAWTEEIGRLTQDRRPSTRLWLYLAGHLLCLAGFARLTQFVLSDEIDQSVAPGAWVLAWAAACAATLAFWLGALLPPRRWLSLARRGLAPVLIGFGLGLATIELGRRTLNLWLPLKDWTLWTVYSVLKFFLADAVNDPANDRVGTSRFEVEIAPYCSGYEGIALIWVFLLFFILYYRKDLRFPQALLLLPLGTAVMWAANVVRIVALIALGSGGYPDIALAGFHSQAGWLTFNVVALGLLAAIRASRFFATPEALAETSGGSWASLPYLTPLLATFAAAMLTAALSRDFDRFYAVRVLAVAATLWYFRRDYASMSWRCSWFAVFVGTATFGLWIALDFLLSVPSSATPLARARSAGLALGWAEAWVVFRALGSLVTVPLAEELAFRGYLTRRLIHADFQLVPLGQFSWFAFVVSSLAFGALHGQRWLAGTLAGMIYALALYRRGRLADAVWAHATTNALIAIYVLSSANGALW